MSAEEAEGRKIRDQEVTADGDGVGWLGDPIPHNLFSPFFGRNNSAAERFLGAGDNLGHNISCKNIFAPGNFCGRISVNFLVVHNLAHLGKFLWPM